jgi:hypothetical protein
LEKTHDARKGAMLVVREASAFAKGERVFLLSFLQQAKKDEEVMVILLYTLDDCCSSQV